MRRPPRSTLDRSSAASDVYKRQLKEPRVQRVIEPMLRGDELTPDISEDDVQYTLDPVSYTHLRAHETVLDLVCRLLLEQEQTTLYIVIAYVTLHIN